MHNCSAIIPPGLDQPALVFDALATLMEKHQKFMAKYQNSKLFDKPTSCEVFVFFEEKKTLYFSSCSTFYMLYLVGTIEHFQNINYIDPTWGKFANYLSIYRLIVDEYIYIYYFCENCLHSNKYI